MTLNQLFAAAGFQPRSVVPPHAWLGHIPFASWLVADFQPTCLVELGTHSGNSFFAFCQAVAAQGLTTRCFAVDTWQGDHQASLYGNAVFDQVEAHRSAHYGGFTQLLRMTFDEALAQFQDGSIDLLHIDGLHTYQAVRHDFDTWLPKLAPGAIVLFHDTQERHEDFGVWQLWAELCERYPAHFEFTHAHGLGVLQLPGGPSERRQAWLQPDHAQRAQLGPYFRQLGAALMVDGLRAENARLTDQTLAQHADIVHLQRIAAIQTAGTTAPGVWQRVTLPLRNLRSGLLQLVNSADRQRSKMRRLTGPLVRLVLAMPRILRFFKGSPVNLLCRVAEVLQADGWQGLYRRSSIFLQSTGKPDHSGRSNWDGLYGPLASPSPDFQPLVSVIVPNFNHAPYLEQRLDSIARQTYNNIEVLLLDDASTDGSQAILQRFADAHPGRARCLFNAVNSGSAFRQWARGLAEAQGALVWIAESDDYCSDQFLETLVATFQHPGVKLAFARTEFVRGNPAATVWTQEDYLSHLQMWDWHTKPFLQSAHALVRDGWIVSNLVPNAAGAVFRHPGALPLLDDPEWLGLRLCGDWLFYLELVRGGLVAYTPAVTNYYRQHPDNTSANTQKLTRYYAEHEVVARYLVRHYEITSAHLERQFTHLYEHWCVRRGLDDEAGFRALYNPERVWPDATLRRPHVLMAVYAFISGGGETFPVNLANALLNEGLTVTMLDCGQQAVQPGIRALLSPRVAVLPLAATERLGEAIANLGAQVVHSHHAWVDMMLAISLADFPELPTVVTMHGMYNMMLPEHLNNVIAALLPRTDTLVYSAERNMSVFTDAQRAGHRFLRIDNALPARMGAPSDRTSLDIPADAFVICMVARALPEKGWHEAIAALALARMASARDLHLVLIGDGPEFAATSAAATSPGLHLLGFRADVREHFAMADLGLLPSRYKGESFPLVLIDCLLAGRPMLASNVGEIAYMLQGGHGLAGELFDLQDWQIDVQDLSHRLVRLANDPDHYRRYCNEVTAAAEKFREATMVERYCAVYRDSLSRVPAARATAPTPAEVGL